MTIAASYPALRPSLLLDFANSKTVDPRITFTRSTTAKYYDGVTTAKAEENLLRYSQEFDNVAAWTQTNCVATSNAATAPDGTLTANTLIPDPTSNLKWLSSAAYAKTSGLTYTASIFAKPNGYQYLQISLSGGSFPASGRKAAFDLTDGTFVVQSGVTAQAVSVGNGWYRISVTVTANVTNAADYAIGIVAIGSKVIDDTSFVPDGTSGYYVWGAQFEQRSAVTAYTPTTTQPITNYIPVLQTAAAGVPRIDHDPVTGECLGLLIEEQRTNLLLRSEQFDNAAWTPQNSTITANTVVAPDGTLTGDKLVENTVTSSHQINSSNSFTSGTTYTFSIYAKAGERTLGLMTLDTGATIFGGVISATFDLSSGTITASNGSPTVQIQSVGNGWYRLSISKTAVATASGNSTGLRTYISAGTSIYTGDGYSGIFIWGAQLEAGAFPTSYIPTVATQETRNADAASMTGTNFSSWYNAGEGTLYAETQKMSLTGLDACVAFAVDDTSNSNRFYINVRSSQNFVATYAGVDQASLLSSVPVIGAYTKIAGAYKQNDFAVSANAATIAADSSGVLPVNVIAARIGGLVTTQYSQTIKKIAYYPQRLTNAQLQALTA